MKKIVLITCVLLSAFLLQGCIAGAVVAGGVAGCAVAADQRSFKSMAADHKIVYNIGKKIRANDSLVKGSHISVVSYNRIVLLVGQAPSEDVRSQVEQLAHDEPTVRRVFNEITIGAPTSAGRRSKDTAITGNVKARLVATTNVSARQVKVVTENGTVYLMGVMNRDQAAVAAQVARNSSGVKQVVKLIEYLNA